MTRITARSGTAGRSLALLALCLLAALPGRADNELEARVKAAFLFNFAKFVSWPPAKLDNPAQAIVFCVLDRDPIATALETTLAGKMLESHPLAVHRLLRGEEFHNCHIAYLGALEGARLPAALDLLAADGALSVYEGEDHLRGGVVRFYLEERKVRFEVNVAAAEREGLQLSSQLLSVARVVRD